MTANRSHLALRQMLSHAREVRDLIAGRDRTDLDRDRLLSLAVVRLLEIVGEAGSRVSDDHRARHPDVPWREVVGLRNRLVHGYDDVDLDVVWSVLRNDVPSLVEALERIVAALPPE